MGLGVKLSEFACAIIKNKGGLCFTKTINPALGIYRNKSKIWRGTTFNGKISQHAKFDKKFQRLQRISYCHEYIGESISGYEELLLPISEMRSKNQIKLF